MEPRGKYIDLDESIRIRIVLNRQGTPYIPLCSVASQ